MTKPSARRTMPASGAYSSKTHKKMNPAAQASHAGAFLVSAGGGLCGGLYGGLCDVLCSALGGLQGSSKTRFRLIRWMIRQFLDIKPLSKKQGGRPAPDRQLFHGDSANVTPTPPGRVRRGCATATRRNARHIRRTRNASPRTETPRPPTSRATFGGSSPADDSRRGASIPRGR